ncbi:SurA N-terminal domain-containing protein [Caldisericum exile]|uniref:peptidylprolyl isomerase n=1 Tax=Caldisericum exile (strain DSM 21853 / NBRC 104410 / AZM16c01) TaxID=511051 RepID=A0A7U6GEG9_CALEA|nr:SurA N-terminal domain-containing protein [Caldisericum exile]BAL80893.1 hypothetical protein CSE_07670 [Caldisericum exile AZM16c01]
MERKKILKKKNKTAKSIKKPLIVGAISVFVIILVLIFIYAGIFLPWKDVYLKVGDNKITYDEMNYQVYLAAKTLNSPLPNIQSNDPKSLAAARNVLQLAYINAISDAVLYNKAKNDGLSISDNEVDSYISNLTESVSSGFNNKELALEDFLNTIGVKKSSLKNVIYKKLLADREVDLLTSHITVSENEIRDFYNEFLSAYVKNENEKEKYFKENYNKIKEDCLKNKKDQYVATTLRRNLINEEINNITVDNPYKRLMRFWYGTFLGTDIPEMYKNVSVQDLLT